MGSRADDLLAFVDESCTARPNDLQEYLMAAALIDRATLEDTMDRLRPPLQGRGLHPGLRVRHAGGELPALWIPDAALGAVNASHHGVLDHLKRLEERIVSDLTTADSL